MSCRWTDEIVAGLAGPDAPGIDREQRRHLDHCGPCQAAVHRADRLDRELEAELRTLHTEELPRSVLSAPAFERGAPTWRRPIAILAGTATIAVTAALAGIALVPNRPASHVPIGGSGSPTTAVSPTVSAAPEPSGSPPASSAAPTSAPAGGQLLAGAIAAVVDEPLVVRTTPGTGNAASITADRLWKGQRVRLLEGPVEADGYPWWRVRIGEIEGWVATQEKDGSTSWIAPISNGEIVYASADQNLRVIDATGGESKPFLNEPLTSLRPVVSCGSSVRLTWAPDGSFAIVADAPACETSLYRVAADGSAARFLADGANPTISGDGTRIAFGQNVYAFGCTPCPVEPPKSWDIETMATDGKTPPQPITITGPSFIATHPSWSPDGRSVAYGGMPGSGEGSGIYVTEATSTRRLTDGATPSWSPDGRWIVFERPTSNGSGTQLFRIRPDGTGLQLLGLGYGSTVAFSPDGSELAVIAERDVEHRFLSVGPFGSRLADGAIVDEALDAAWSPDGQRLAWSVADANALRIWVGNPDGSDAQPVADGMAPSWRPVIAPAPH